MKRLFLIFCLMVSAMFATSQETKVSFKGIALNGSYCPYDVVNVTNVTRGWNETLVYPDTVFILSGLGVEEESFPHEGIIQVFPNPFVDYTNIEFGVSVSGPVDICVVSVNGAKEASWKGYVQSGIHQFRIALEKPQMAFVVITTETKRYVGKLLHIGGGDVSEIDLCSSSPVTSKYSKNSDCSYGGGGFVPGDIMSYEGVILNNGSMINSTKVTQAQYGDETISLVFPVTEPDVDVVEVRDISETSAMIICNVTESGGLTVTERGIAWMADSDSLYRYQQAGSGVGDYMVEMNSLTENTTYYVFAYAVNPLGKAFSDLKVFTTLSEEPTPPDPEIEIYTLPYYQDFTSEFGSYMPYDVYGAQSWMIDYNTAKMTGYVYSTNNANEDWLISSPVAITDVSDAKMTMVYIGRYFNSINEDVTIWASVNYTWGSDPTTATWTQVPATLSEGNNWTDFKTAEIALTQWVGQTVTFAVKYVSTDVKAGTMEIQSITIEEVVPTPPPGPGTGCEVQSLPYFQGFTSEFGTYMPYDVYGAQSWMIDYNTAKMTGYVYSTYNVNEDWLISSPVAITDVSDAKMTMVYIGRYFNSINEVVTVWASANYTWGSDPTTATWTQLPALLREGSNWNDFLTTEISLTEYVGQTVTFAVKYTSTDNDAGTIEIQSITIEEGSGEEPPTPPTPGGEVQSLPYFQGFTSEFGTYLTYDAYGAQSWMIDYNTAKMTGYAYGTNNANEDWLISSPVAIMGVSEAKMTMVYIGRYFNNINEDVTIWASTDYTYGNDPATATWTQVPSTLSEGSNWSDFKTAEIALTQWVGQTVTFAVKYVSTDVNAGTIEIQSITVEEGSVDVPPTPPTPGEGEGSGTAEDPYNVAAGISLQSGEPIAWVQGYIVGAVKSGSTMVTSNADINWSGPFDLATNVVIADDPTCQEISLCIIVNLPAGKPLRATVNLIDNPENLGKQLSVLGKLRRYFGQAGLRDSNGTEEDFVLE